MSPNYETLKILGKILSIKQREVDTANELILFLRDFNIAKRGTKFDEIERHLKRYKLI